MKILLVESGESGRGHTRLGPPPPRRPPPVAATATTTTAGSAYAEIISTRIWLEMHAAVTPAPRRLLTAVLPVVAAWCRLVGGAPPRRRPGACTLLSAVPAAATVTDVTRSRLVSLFRPEGAASFPDGAMASSRLSAILAKVCPDGWTGSVIQATLAADSAFSKLKPAPQISSKLEIIYLPLVRGPIRLTFCSVILGWRVGSCVRMYRPLSSPFSSPFFKIS